MVMTSLPAFLVPEQVVTSDGIGELLFVEDRGKLQVTLGITSIIEQQALEVSLWTSPDGTSWDKRPTLLLPQKFYKGISAYVLDLSQRPEKAQYVQARWKITRWGRGVGGPRFGFYVFVASFA